MAVQGKQGRSGAVVEVHWSPPDPRSVVAHTLQCVRAGQREGEEVYSGPMTAWFGTTLPPGQVCVRTRLAGCVVVHVCV